MWPDWAAQLFLPNWYALSLKFMSSCIHVMLMSKRVDEANVDTSSSVESFSGQIGSLEA